MIQSLLEEHSHVMMLKHYPTKHLLPPLNQYSAMGPFVFLEFFSGKGGGTQVCRSRMETDSYAGDVGPSSWCENSTTFTHDYSYTTQVEGKRQILMSMERRMFCVSNWGSACPTVV